MEYNREECCKHIIWRLCEIVHEDVAKGHVKTREEYIEQSKGLHIGYFKNGARALLFRIDMDEEHEFMKKDIEEALDKVLVRARQKVITKQIITTSMKQIIERPLTESGLEFRITYNIRSADVRVRILGNRWLSAHLEYSSINESLGQFITAAQATKELYQISGSKICLKFM